MSLRELLCLPRPSGMAMAGGTRQIHATTRAAEEGKLRPPLRYRTRKINERTGNVYENKG